MNSRRLAKKMSKICVLLERHGVKVNGEFYITPECEIKEFSAASRRKVGFVYDDSRSENE